MYFLLNYICSYYTFKIGLKIKNINYLKLLKYNALLKIKRYKCPTMPTTHYKNKNIKQKQKKQNTRVQTQRDFPSEHLRWFSLNK